MSVDYNDDNSRIIIAHTVDADNIYQIQADSNGVWYHKKDAGSWSTVPLAISAGGTGATGYQAARQNLGFCFKDGDTLTMGASYPFPGYITENSTRLIFNLITPKGMDYTSTITITAMSLVFRGVSGYLDSNNALRNCLASPLSTTATRLNANTIRFQIDKTSAFTNVTNNTPVCLTGTWTLKFNT